MRWAAVVVSWTVVLVLHAPEARAAEDEALVAVSGGAGLGASDESPALAGGVDVWVGLDDFWWLEFSAGGSLVSELSRGGVELGAGLVWALDVLAWVPWLGGSLGVVFEDDGDVIPVGRAGLGVDRILGPEWAVGFYGRAHAGPRQAGGFRLVAGLRLAYRLQL